MPDGATPFFKPDRVGLYRVRLIVHDGKISSAIDTVEIMAESGNQPPVADAGPDQRGAVHGRIELDGTGSLDPEGQPLSYFWTFRKRPVGSAAQLLDSFGPKPALLPDALGDYLVELVVSDGESDSAPDVVKVTVVDAGGRPVARIDGDALRLAEVGVAVALDGTSSSDPDGDPLQYAWRLLSAPAGSQVALTGTTFATTALVPDVVGIYRVELQVSDGASQSQPAVVTLLAKLPSVAGCLILTEIVEGSGFNKAVELTNTCVTSVDTGDYGLCLVSNTSTTCSQTTLLPSTMLAAGATFGVCHPSIDPALTPAGSCDVHDNLANFNGDDRLVLFLDGDRDGLLGAVDTVVDAFGQTATRPSGTPWADQTLRRCDLTPYDGAGTFVLTDYFSIHPIDDLSHFGIAPPQGSVCQ